MTDAELRDAAWAEFQLTTDSYPTWKRKGFPASSHWAKGKALLDQIGQTVPDPTPIPVPGGQPWANWFYEITLNHYTPPLPHEFSFLSDGRVKLSLFQNTTIAGAGTSNARQLVSCWLPNGVLGVVEGTKTRIVYDVEIVDTTTFTTGQFNWLCGSHTLSSIGKLSNTIGVFTDYPVDFTKRGAHPVWGFQVGGGAMTAPKKFMGLPVTNGRYVIQVDDLWSATNGYRKITINGTQQLDYAGPTYYPGDKPGLGVYNYSLAVAWDRAVIHKQPVWS